MNNGLILCLMTAIGFGGWPLIARFAGTNSAWTGFVVMGASVLISTIFYRNEIRDVPNAWPMALLLIGGIANGIGMVAYTKLVTDQQFGMSSWAPAALTLMVVFMTIAGAAVFKEAFPATKVLGLALACTGTWLMVK